MSWTEIGALVTCLHRSCAVYQSGTTSKARVIRPSPDSKGMV